MLVGFKLGLKKTKLVFRLKKNEKILCIFLIFLKNFFLENHMLPFVISEANGQTNVPFGDGVQKKKTAV